MSSVAYTMASTAPSTGARGTMASSAIGASSASVKMTRGGPGKTPFRHIDDLVSVSVDLDPHTPLRKILELGDAHMRQAITFNDFGRPDLALQEYIKAFTIAVDKVPRHKDYPSMKSDRSDQNRLYNTLKLKITTNCAVFDEIKEDIKQDNQRSGVQPTLSNVSVSNLLDRLNVSSNTSQQTQLSVSTDTHKSQAEDEHDASNAVSVTNGAGAGRRQKPAVQPKPQALHGKVIRQTQKPLQEDLADRFARLRESKKSVPATPGESSLQQSLPSLDTSVVAMPKPPQAIYNPARGTVTSEAANLPSSSPRGMFSRANSITTAPSAPREQFVAANTYGASQPFKAARARISADDTITATALARLINQHPQGINILIIDVRDRESFDEGHIKSHGTICVEPEILMRENISADEIVDSMVLAPATERLAIEQRDKVDLVVIYDENSTSIPTRVTGSSSEMVLYNIRQALSYYSYSRPLKDSPKLLRGGLESWVNEFGTQSLETSDTTSGYAHPSAKFSSKYGSRKRSRAKVRTLSSDEVKQFEDMIHQDGDGTFDYVKTRDDFVRRYPSITAAPESMMSSALQKHQKPGRPLDPQEEDYLAGIGPAPPRRPAPAMPRTRYSGFESTDDNSTVGAIAKMAPASSPGRPRYLTGLSWVENNCFANSAMQAFLASPRLVDEFLSPNFPRNWRVSEVREPAKPQLMSKIVANTLQWMHKREFNKLTVTTLMHYLRAVHPGYKIFKDENDKVGDLFKFGDGHQHDTDEFTTFINQQLAAETDISPLLRNWPFPTLRPGASNLTQELVRHFWTYQTEHASLVSKYFTAMAFRERSCSYCHATEFTSDARDVVYCSPHERGRDIVTLLREDGMAVVDDFHHDKCDKTTRQVIQDRYLRLPPVLRILLRRGQAANGLKAMYGCPFPEILDMTQFTYNATTRQQVSDAIGAPFNEGLTGSTQYELYGVQVHSGRHMNHGHYWSYVRQKSDGDYDGANNKCWFSCNDATITPLSPAQWQQEHNQMSGSSEVTPMQLFYRRMDVKYDNYKYGTGPGLSIEIPSRA
ncbi:cysteine proteinase [Hypoxylon cercidicola]|nr:cysteine proteinase [Hypoxylon cercidicola]